MGIKIQLGSRWSDDSISKFSIEGLWNNCFIEAPIDMNGKDITDVNKIVADDLRLKIRLIWKVIRW